MIRILIYGISYMTGGVENFLYNYMSRLQQRDDFQIDFLSIHEKLHLKMNIVHLGAKSSL